MAADSNYLSVGLLLLCNGTNGSTTITDSSISPKNGTAAGNAQISTAQSKYGGASLLLDGAGDYVSFPYNSAWDFGTGDFTFEAWVRTSAPSSTEGIIGRQEGTTGGLIQFRKSSGAFDILIRDTNNTGLITVSGGTVATNTWQHVAATRSGSTLRLFVDGVLVNSGTSSVNLTYAASKPMIIGGIHDGTNVALTWTGNIDDLRITKGVARYTATFTPPAAELPEYAGQISGTVLDSTAAAASRTVRAYRRDTGALMGSATSDGGTGAYTINCKTLDECTVICLDNSGGTLENDLILRTTPA